MINKKVLNLFNPIYIIKLTRIVLKIKKLTFFFLILLVVCLCSNGYSQSGNCGPNVPYYSVDLTGNPNGTWFSDPPTVRQGSCCGSTPPDRCVEFGVLLDSGAVAISFNIAEGAVPPGALFYQVNCGSITPVGEVICISGVGPHYITFCKPGANLNVYSSSCQ